MPEAPPPMLAPTPKILNDIFRPPPTVVFWLVELVKELLRERLVPSRLLLL